MARLSINQRVQWLPLAVTALCTAALALLLFTGVQQAARLQSASSALQLASSLTAQPQLLHSELTLIQRGLETQTYVGDSLRSLAAGRTASNRAYAHLASAMQDADLATRADTAALYAQARAHWQPLDTLRFIGGLSYDRLVIPSNFRSAPVSAGWAPSPPPRRPRASWPWR